MLLFVGLLNNHVIDREGHKEEPAEDVLYTLNINIMAEFGFVMLCQLEKFYIFSENVQAFLLRLDNAKNNGADAPGRDQDGEAQKKQKHSLSNCK